MLDYKPVTNIRWGHLAYLPKNIDSGAQSGKTITATSQQSTPDYTLTCMVPGPSSSILEILCICARLQATVSSWGGGGTTLNFTIHKDGTQVATGTLTTAAATGALPFAVDIKTGTLVGSGGVYTIYFWVNTGSCVLSAVELWAAVGSCATATPTNPAISINITGIVNIEAKVHKIGSGTPTISYQSSLRTDDYNACWGVVNADYGEVKIGSAINFAGDVLVALGTVATDLNHVYEVTMNYLELS